MNLNEAKQILERNGYLVESHLQGHCDRCGIEIFSDEAYYRHNGKTYCADCHDEVVKPNGKFEFYSKKDDLSSFGNPVLDACSDYLTDNKGKEKTVIANSSGDIIVISRTPSYLLPFEEIFKLEKIGRDKESRNKYLEGVVDINLYNDCYSVGIKGSGMNTRIPKAPHLYQIDIIKGVNFIEELLETMAVTFVKYNFFTVMPYPIKYLNEYILMNEMNNNK